MVSTVPANVDYDAFLRLLALDGTFVNLGVPKKPISFDVFSLLRNRRSIAGTLVGGIARDPGDARLLRRAQDRGHRSRSSAPTNIDVAYDRVAAADVRYRFVIDISTMAVR